MILVIGAVLRILWIEQPYVDLFGWRESSTAMMAENYFKTNGNIFYPEVNWSGPGPNYQGREFQTVTYIASIFYRFLGQQDWIGRSVAVVFGVWGIFALYKLVALAWDKRAAIAAAAIMAILPASIFIERSFMPDPAMVASDDHEPLALCFIFKKRSPNHLNSGGHCGCIWCPDQTARINNWLAGSLCDGRIAAQKT